MFALAELFVPVGELGIACAEGEDGVRQRRACAAIGWNAHQDGAVRPTFDCPRFGTHITIHISALWHTQLSITSVACRAETHFPTTALAILGQFRGGQGRITRKVPAASCQSGRTTGANRNNWTPASRSAVAIAALLLRQHRGPA